MTAVDDYLQELATAVRGLRGGRDLVDEARDHLEEARAAASASGRSEEEAAAIAVEQFGPVEQVARDFEWSSEARRRLRTIGAYPGMVLTLAAAVAGMQARPHLDLAEATVASLGVVGAALAVMWCVTRAVARSLMAVDTRTRLLRVLVIQAVSGRATLAAIVVGVMVAPFEPTGFFADRVAAARVLWLIPLVLVAVVFVRELRQVNRRLRVVSAPIDPPAGTLPD